MASIIGGLSQILPMPMVVGQESDDTSYQLELERRLGGELEGTGIPSRDILMEYIDISEDVVNYIYDDKRKEDGKPARWNFNGGNVGDPTIFGGVNLLEQYGEDWWEEFSGQFGDRETYDGTVREKVEGPILDDFESRIINNLGQDVWDGLSPWTKTALHDFVHNHGVAGTFSSKGYPTMIRHIKEGNYEGAANQAGDWFTEDLGVDNKGRRIRHNPSRVQFLIDALHHETDRRLPSAAKMEAEGEFVAGSDFIRPQRAREAEQRARDILDDAKFRQRNPDLGFGLVDTRRGFRGREMR